MPARLDSARRADAAPAPDTEREATSAPDRRRLLRIDEAAHLMTLGVSTLYRMVQQKKITHVRAGSQIRIPAWAVEQWLDRNTVHAVDDRPDT